MGFIPQVFVLNAVIAFRPFASSCMSEAVAKSQHVAWRPFVINNIAV